MPNSSHSDSDSDQDDAQMRQFLEAADHTLLNNAMFQPKSKFIPAAQSTLKSERHLNEETDCSVHDLQISQEMQTHLWSKLSKIIQDQIEFTREYEEQPEEEKSESCIKLVSNAECYLSAELREIEPPAPTKKPLIKRRQLKEEISIRHNEAQALAACAVSGESILEGKDMLGWAHRRPRPDKLFSYKASQKKGLSVLLAVEPTNEFTPKRKQNKWNESLIKNKKSFT